MTFFARRRAALSALLVLVFILLAACAPNPALRYEDLFDELDIGERCTDVAYHVQNRQHSERLRGQIHAIMDDLASIAPKDEQLIEINNDFIDCARLLEEAMDAYAAGDDALAQKKYSTAEVEYNNADTALNAYKRKLAKRRQNGS